MLDHHEFHRVIDPATGESPELRSGDSISFTTTVIDGVAIPDGITPEGEPVQHVTVLKEVPADEDWYEVGQVVQVAFGDGVGFEPFKVIATRPLTLVEVPR